jgi:hypothetical protein
VGVTPGGSIGLDGFLDRVLHSVSYRRAFLEGRTDDLELSDDDLDAVRGLDRDQLLEAANAVRAGLLGRRHRGSGGLQAMYPRTLGAREPGALMDRFMESPAFADYREVPYAGEGLSLEEAFFRFCDAEDIGAPEDREAEFLAGLMKALALSPRPAFRVGPPARRAPGGWFAVSTQGEPVLFAAVGGKFVQGRLTPFLAELLTSEEPAKEVAQTHDIDGAVLDAAIERFTQLGLLSPGT